MKTVRFSKDEFYPFVSVQDDDDPWNDFSVSLPDEIIAKIKKQHADFLVLQNILWLIGDRDIKEIDTKSWQKLELEAINELDKETL